jgi:sortase A
MRRDPSSPLLRVIEWTLLAIGVAGLAGYGWTMIRIHQLQSDARIAVEEMLAGQQLRAHVEPPMTLTNSGPIGQLDIPRLHVSAIVMEGDDQGVLDFAVGHLPDTPQPWQSGNSALAAHRDRLFRPLESIRIGDDIWFATRHGNFQYRVRRTLVVNPRDVWVLDSIPDVSLTLITCFPFSYIGEASQRFIVQAERVGSPAP